MYKSFNPFQMSKCRYWTSPPCWASTHVCVSFVGRGPGFDYGSWGKAGQAYPESTYLTHWSYPCHHAGASDWYTTCLDMPYEAGSESSTCVYLKLRRLKKLECRVIRMIRGTRVVKLRLRIILWTLIHVLYIFCILYNYDWIWGSKIWPIYVDIYSHTHTHISIAGFIYMCFCKYLLYIFMKNLLSASPRYN